MTHSPKQRRLTFAAAAAFLLGALPALAQGAPADAQKDFRPYGDYMLVVDGKEVPNAEIFFSEKAPAFLVMTSKLDAPVLLSVRSQTVETLQLMKVAKQQDGSVDLLPNAALAAQGSFTVTGEGTEVSCKVDRHTVLLRTRPPLLGLHAAGDLKAYSPPIYVEGGRTYRPDNQVIAALKRAPAPVTVRVFFGSWCPHCQHYVPLLLRVEDELKGSKIKFEYFGLPKSGMTNVPEAKKFGINSVPTGIVFVNGKEAGRLTGNAWGSPETSLATIVNGAMASR
ncbi:MAG TPA: thioredoxin family protein [Thermoanaerobaculia bacterium]|nr:thioredoxin family protein [Thermoanaerobaculia bacterium]